MAELTQAAVTWAAGRGIGRATLDRLGVGSGMAAMPPEGHQCEIISFPYRRGAEVVNIKARALADKAYRQEKGGELRFWNLDAVLGSQAEQVYITEGEFDVLALVEAGIPVEEVVSVPNGAPIRSSTEPEEMDRYRFVEAGLAEGFNRVGKFDR